MNIGDLGALVPVFRAERARRRLLPFAQLVYPGFQAPPWIYFLMDLLERLERGDLLKVMINVPVRHGKSVTCSQIFPAWFLGRHPALDVILASHAKDLAARNSRVAKSLFLDNLWPFSVRLASDSTAAAEWNTTAGGGCFAIGVDGGVTGRGANILIIDDALHDARSEAECKAAWVWYSEVAVPRLEPGAATIMIGARFAENDLCGRILASEDGPNWHVVNLPALALEGDPLGRAVGEPLWEARYGVAELEERRVRMGSRAFEAQFQQNPLPAGGDLVRAEDLEHRYERVPDDLGIVFGMDAAAKTGIANDWSAIAVLGSSRSHHYLLEMIRRKVDYPALRRMLLSAAEQYAPRVIYVEDTSNATAMIQELRSGTRLPIVPVQAKGSKISRMEAQIGVLQAGKLLLPSERLSAPWLFEFMREMLSLPNGRFDDQADALFIALAKVSQQSSSTASFCFASNTAGRYSSSPVTRGDGSVYTPPLPKFPPTYNRHASAFIGPARSALPMGEANPDQIDALSAERRTRTTWTCPGCGATHTCDSETEENL